MAARWDDWSRQQTTDGRICAEWTDGLHYQRVDSRVYAGPRRRGRNKATGRGATKG